MIKIGSKIRLPDDVVTVGGRIMAPAGSVGIIEANSSGFKQYHIAFSFKSDIYVNRLSIFKEEIEEISEEEYQTALLLEA